MVFSDFRDLVSGLDVPASNDDPTVATVEHSALVNGSDDTVVTRDLRGLYTGLDVRASADESTVALAEHSPLVKGLKGDLKKL